MPSPAAVGTDPTAFENIGEDGSSRPRRRRLPRYAGLWVVALLINLLGIGFAGLWVLGVIQFEPPRQGTDPLGDQPAPAPPEAIGQHGAGQPAERSIPLPVFACRKMSETAETLERYCGERVVVVGPVVRLATTGFSHRTFWEVPEGLGTASLSDDPDEDRAQVECVFRGGRPASLAVGTPCRIEGTFRGVIATSGVPLLVDCELAAEGR